MPGVWTITFNGVEKTCAAWGLTARPQIKTRDRSPTQFSFRMAGAAPEAAIPFPSYINLLNSGRSVAQAEAQSRIVIKQYSTYTAGAWGGLLYTFVGYLATQPAEVDGHGQGVVLVFKDALWLLQNTTFQQYWIQASTPAAPVYISRCVLFMDIGGWIPNTYQSVQWQLTQIIAYAAACGIAIAPGTIDYSGWYLNYYQCRAISCWEAILKCLEPIPDAKVWVDGSTATPTLNIRTRANLAALASPAGTGPGPITLPYKGTDAGGRQHFSSKSFTPRFDLIPPQVVLQYQINNTFNGKSAPSWTNDVYPAVVGGNSDGQMPFAVVCPIDLTGNAITTETGTLDCQPLMVTSAQTGYAGGSAADHAAKRAWWATKRGGEQDKLADFRVRFGTNTLGDATVVDDNGNPINLAQYPNRLVKGTYHSWMAVTGVPVLAIRAHIRVSAQYSEWDVPSFSGAETDVNGNQVRRVGTQELHCHVTLTNAPGGVTNFVGSQLTAVGETPVANLAKNIFNSRSTLDYDGEHEIIDGGLPNAIIPTAALTQLIGHWNVLNFSGGKAAWLNANMTIAGTEIDLMTNHIRIEVGPSKHLQPQDWSSMLQFFRYRRLSMDNATRATGFGGSNNNVDMAKNTPDGNTVPGLAVDALRVVIAPDAVDGTRTNLIQQDATTTQIAIVQQPTAGGAAYTTGVIAPEYNGVGAPSATTLVASAYYRVGDKYVDTGANTMYRCTTAGSNSTSVWAQISGGGEGGNWNYRGMWTATPTSAYMTYDVVSFGSGSASGCPAP